jgi:uncharacterized protein
VAKPKVPAVDGWFTLDTDEPRLIGTKCSACGTVVFPPRASHCPNPDCDAVDLEPTELSSRGTVWSYTNACYQPPPPFVSRSDPYMPITLAAVHLPVEQMVVLGQVADGIGVDDLMIGQEMRLTIGTLFEDEDTEHLVWKWAPAAQRPAGRADREAIEEPGKSGDPA